MKEFIKKNLIWIIIIGVIIIGLGISTIVLGVKYNNLKNKEKESNDSNDSNVSNETNDSNDSNDSNESITNTDTDVEYNYDFYITLGTMPTLYATLNAYQNQNPNTYMWFFRGNTISKQYSADFIHYFSTQSSTNANSKINYLEIRKKVKEILIKNPASKFTLYCDDLRTQFILDIFVAAGVEFEDLKVVLLSDGTGTYSNYAAITEDGYVAQKEEWKNYLKNYINNRNNDTYTQFSSSFNTQATNLQLYCFYVSSFSNVMFWIQHPDYLINTVSNTINKERFNMNIIKKDPKAIYNSLDSETNLAFQKVVLANALVDSDTLTTLEDAVEYFDSKLKNRDKDVVLILGSSDNSLSEIQKSYLDQTLKFYTPTLDSEDNTKVKYKGIDYSITSGQSTVSIDGKDFTIGQIGVYLFFKGHPSYPANAQLKQYFNEKGIIILPHRTPVETLFWMYTVKCGGYTSTSFLSTSEGQTEFFYGEVNGVVLTMKNLGFFNNAVTFNA